ncbi:thioredoxin family protein [uncultured Pseudodesulfovibrio sp.]|uniref:thioredoxin family protein n=1 Tax=uncultured Pseudodesulfovibrio sp. TaxID=2035858 RepID=UPI0029C61B7C|nr:thioredoxin family protein [uncultured Pseudodesulfovibrio sp.]
MRMIKTIEPQAIDIELQNGDGPLLVAFLKRNEKYSGQVAVLESACRTHGESVRCFLYNADYLDTATDRFAVKGTPTFLLFHEGREVNRLIGESDGPTLDEFIDASVEGLSRTVRS